LGPFPPLLSQTLLLLADRLAGADAAKFWGIVLCLALLSLTCFRWGFRRFRWARLLEDTPTARVETAPQGYVEVSGRGAARTDRSLHCPLTSTPCLWYRYRIECRRTDSRGERKGSSWSTVELEQSREAFWLEDATGRCLVVPAGAEITPTVRKRWYGDSARPEGAATLSALFAKFRYTEELLLPGGDIHVLGWFETIRPGMGNAEAEVNDKLRRLKEDHAALLERFDRNKDGDISVEEWDEAREAIRREVLNARSLAKPADPVHTVTVPSDPSLPFLVAGVPQSSLAGKYRWQAVLALALFFLAGAAAARLVERRSSRRASLSAPSKSGTLKV
jgi:hypothetical protein